MNRLVQLFVIVTIQPSYSSAVQIDINNTSNDCDQLCLKCGPHGCIKCPNLIIYPSRICATTCPFGHHPRWSTLADYMGRICQHSGHLLGLRAETATVVAGVAAGALLCLILVAGALLYLRARRKALLHAAADAASDTDDRDFHKRLEALRPHAAAYLEMLNDTRRQLRALHRGGDAGALVAYKPVVRDLAKVLLLLNRRTDQIRVPDEWEHLFNWAEKALKRYKRMSDVSQPQVAQLISFLQGADETLLQESELRGSTTMSTFKPEQVFSASTLSLKNSGGSGDLSNLNPQWKFEYSLMDQADSPSEFNSFVWRNSSGNNKEYLSGSVFLDDDFCQLGFRPQDEITTEL